MKQKIGSTRLLTTLVVLLLGIVSVQSVFLFNLYRSDKDEPVKATEADVDFKIVPKQQARTVVPQPRSRVPLAVPQIRARNWDPFSEMQRMQEEMDQMFEQAFGRLGGQHPGAPSGLQNSFFSPQLDLEDDGDNYIARFDIPGADKSNIDVQINDRTLTVSGVSQEEIEKKDGNQVIHVERRSGEFKRSISLPGPVESSAMQAEYQDGVLTVTVPKADFSPTSRSVRVL